MKLTVYRDSGGQDSTLGRLCIGTGAAEYLFCYTCEDQRQLEKVAGETRIPAGLYEIKKRLVSPMARRYDHKYDDIAHNGMLHLQDVPEFTDVYVHVGNDDDDSQGCLLVGYIAYLHPVYGGGSIGRSSDAYKALYKFVGPAIDSGEQVFIEIKDEGIK